ncbi:glycosyltransferase involved in cell wall biosynthesis [Streptomyces sp. SAI-117]|uniref:glycosyltransferase family 2 protein n=1 Tax=Streptomyces sp. SAI-117 TaxID=2940546 RepID=UPI00247603BB|nr:glycosyltransferase family A protein [Streptomyces sp. SAI-117]MDH6565884.1 glycosyltransferase involved in cell wall biosynthesis [Streptomyces sp. SAI-117]
MPVKVSVVIPVYNPGEYIEDCVASLRRQSLPPDEFEAIFVDDGSTDATPARLDALAAEVANITVIHQEASGWSGKPRNVGIEASRGEFVMFVDNDDYLGDEALERMYDYGVANGADVVVGKMAGKGRGVPVELFRRNHPRATVDSAPLIDSLTPHKMFRRAFLDRIGLRFPEGRRRLEDHVFVTEAYLRADNVSVLSDYVCYYHLKRDDASNAGFQRFDPVGYFANLREALDIVEKYTEPGPSRDRLFRRWLRNEMVERMRGRRLLAAPEDYRKELFTEIRGVVVERFGPGVAAGLQPIQQVVAALIADGRLDDLVAFAEWEAPIAAKAEPDGVAWEDGVLRIGLSAELASRGAPLTFPAEGGATPLTKPPASVEEAVDWVGAHAVDGFQRATVDLLVQERASSAQYFQPVDFTRESVPDEDGRVRLVLRGTATVDPAVAADGGPLGAGQWDVFVRVKLAGCTKQCRLGPVPLTGRSAANAGVTGGHVVLPYWTAKGCLALDVDAARKRLGFERVTPGEVTVAGDRVEMPVPMHVPRDTPVLLELTRGSGTAPAKVPGTLRPQGSAALLDAVLPVGDLPGADWQVALSPAPEAEEPRFHPLPFALRVRRGRVEAVAVRAPRPPVGRTLVRRARRLAGKLVRRFRALGR